MPLSARQNSLRNASFQGHEWIPQSVCISSAYWHIMRADLEEVCLRHPALFPHLRQGQVDYDAGILSPADRRRMDAWGCLWEYPLDGLDGLVLAHPLADWAHLDAWQPPTPPILDDITRAQLQSQRARGELLSCGTEHGFLFMRLFYLRGFANLMMDMADEEPRLDRLIETIATYWEQALRPYLALGVDVLQAADDLGTETASIVGPKQFRRWLLPSYQRLFRPFRQAGAHVFMHHDGYIMDIMDDIIESGVSVVNPQDLVNGIDNLAREVKGRVCICIDIDRQRVLPFGSPADVRDLIAEEVLKLGSPAGGLEMIVGIYPPTPLENVAALLDALEEYRTYWVGR